MREEEWRWRRTISNLTLDITSFWMDDEVPSPCGSRCNDAVEVNIETGVVKLWYEGLPHNLTEMIESNSSGL